MNARQNMKSGSTIEEQLRSVQMSQHERNAALHAVGIAEVFVGAILWVCGKVARPRTDVFAKPNLKYRIRRTRVRQIPLVAESK